ncbi:hypothetical protein [Glutamicibacter sp. JC586]|uniref:hypothetical protein n=1 Tax=Glutamicibacter sp. JC586 TaxID=2590552 RepID=UPI00135A6ADF|nr:hypothetical protein [Glutamicibacter sp. JC586]
MDFFNLEIFECSVAKTVVYDTLIRMLGAKSSTVEKSTALEARFVAKLNAKNYMPIHLCSHEY